MGKRVLQLTLLCPGVSCQLLSPWSFMLLRIILLLHPNPVAYLKCCELWVGIIGRFDSRYTGFSFMPLFLLTLPPTLFFSYFLISPFHYLSTSLSLLRSVISHKKVLIAPAFGLLIFHWTEKLGYLLVSEAEVQEKFQRDTVSMVPSFLIPWQNIGSKEHVFFSMSLASPMHPLCPSRL